MSKILGPSPADEKGSVLLLRLYPSRAHYYDAKSHLLEPILSEAHLLQETHSFHDLQGKESQHHSRKTSP